MTKEKRVDKPERSATNTPNKPYVSAVGTAQRALALNSTGVFATNFATRPRFLATTDIISRFLTEPKWLSSNAFIHSGAAWAAIDTSASLKALTASFASQPSTLDRLIGSGALAANVGGYSSWLTNQTRIQADLSAPVSKAYQPVIGSIMSTSTLLNQLKQNGSLAKALHNVETTRDALETIGGLAKASIAASSIASLVKPYELPDLALMTSLATSRLLLGTVSPVSRSVDRIGKGWASLSDRLLGGDLDLATLMPGFNRLATKAFQLDILVGQGELTYNEELLTARTASRDFAAEWLAQLSTRLCDRWIGMWDRMRERGPDWRSQAANSAVELLDGLIELLAADDLVQSWQVRLDCMLTNTERLELWDQTAT